MKDPKDPDQNPKDESESEAETIIPDPNLSYPMFHARISIGVRCLNMNFKLTTQINN